MVLCQNKKVCALCNIEVTQEYIGENEKSFCCHGCLAVYQILSSKKELSHFSSHPLFIQAVKSGLISNPKLLQEIEANRLENNEDEVKKLHLEISDMWCPSCAEVIYLILMQEKGILHCLVDYATDMAVIEYVPRYISKEDIFKKISSLGYGYAFLEDMQNKKVSIHLYLKFIVAAFCSLNIMMFSYPLYASYFDYDPLQYGLLFASLSFILSLPILTFSFYPIWKKFLNALRVGVYGMETLVVFGVFSSFILSCYELAHLRTKVYFDSMAMIITFVLLGKIIETKAKFSMKDTLIRLHFSIPRKVRKPLENGCFHFVPIKEIKQGDLFAVFQGEKIPLDGRVVEGNGFCDESVMTGESLPVCKQVASSVIGGSILQNGNLMISSVGAVEKSTISKIIDLVETGLKSKSTYKRAVDPILLFFVPAILVIASLTAFYSWVFVGGEMALLKALSIILIACPCAIGIAVPLAEAYLMKRLLKLGIIIRNRACMPFIGKETVFVFDKTGTVTEGKFQVFQGLEHLSELHLRVLKAMTGKSNHLIALSIFKSILEPFVKLDKIEEIAGKGIRAVFNSTVYHLGSSAFLTLEGIEVDENGGVNEEDLIYSKVYFAVDFKLKSVLFLGDNLKEGAKEFISALKPATTILLSGDSKNAVDAVFKACCFDMRYFGYSPLQKAEVIKNLKKTGHIVCMVGDGINDAPALAEAHVGISLVTAADVSIQVSDILLTNNSLSSIPEMRFLSLFGQSVLKQNLFWAFFYNVIGVFLAVVGELSPIFATFAMMISSLIVYYNAKRIERWD